MATKCFIEALTLRMQIVLSIPSRQVSILEVPKGFKHKFVIQQQSKSELEYSLQISLYRASSLSKLTSLSKNLPKALRLYFPSTSKL